MAMIMTPLGALIRIPAAADIVCVSAPFLSECCPGFRVCLQERLFHLFKKDIAIHEPHVNFPSCPPVCLSAPYGHRKF